MSTAFLQTVIQLTHW